MAAANLAPAAGMPGRPLLAGYRRFYPKGQDKKPAFVAKVPRAARRFSGVPAVMYLIQSSSVFILFRWTRTLKAF